MWCGGLALAYFFFWFDVGVVTSYGDHIVNQDLVQQRLIGVIISIAAIALGVFLAYGGQQVSQPVGPLPPVNPNLKWAAILAGFAFLAYCVSVASHKEKPQESNWQIVPMHSMPGEEERARGAFGI